MKRIAISGIVLLALAGAALPQTKPTKSTPKIIKCAVMAEDDVDIAKATKNKMYIDYKGKRYFFCCDSCIGAFKKNPAKYAKSPSLPTPRAKPSKPKS